MAKLVYGVGINTKDRPTTDGKKMRKEYQLWVDMLRRCYSDKWHKTKPTYVGCSVSDNFKSYSYFYDWCQNQVGFGIDGYDLDKDFIKKGNKLYSEDTCFFIPREINSILNDCRSSRGDFPIGVKLNEYGKYVVRISKKCRLKHVGVFDNKDEAFAAYKREKEIYLVDRLNFYKDSMDYRVVKSIINYRVDITD